MNESNMMSVVIPVFNEEANLEELIHRCLEACRRARRPFEIILVDDGSSDRSADMLDEAAAAHPEAIVAVFLNRNYGQHAAIMAGFEQVRGEIVITLDADLQNPPEEIPRLAEAMDQGFDVVGYRAGQPAGYRFSQNRLGPDQPGRPESHRRDDARLRLHAAGLSRPHRPGHAHVPRTQHLHPGAGQQLCPQDHRDRRRS